MSTSPEAKPQEDANGAPVYKPGEIDFDTLDDTPEDYRKMLRTLIGKQYVGEIAACEMFSRAVFHLPDPRHKAALVHTANEEAEHVEMMDELARKVGLDVDGWLERRRPAGSHFLGSTEDVTDWLEVSVFKHMIDRCGRVWLWSMRQTSFKPYADVIRPILQDEARHGQDGAEEVGRLCEAGHRDEVQERVDYWFPRGMQLLGKPGSEGNRVAHHYGLKLHDSDEEMAKWIGELKPPFETVGVSLPTPEQVRERGVDTAGVSW
jgi:1,2-phenylacetyl-CoA epoxidase catalytic subunit